MTVIEIADRIQTEADAYAFLEELRWKGAQPTCGHCGSDDTVFITPRTGVSRKTRTGAASQRRVWRCRSCRRQFSVLTGTIFHGTKISIRKWALVVFEMCASKNGVSAREIQRKYGLCERTAWFMLHRIREAMRDNGLAMFRGVVIADETYIGGSVHNKPNSFRHARNAPQPYTKRAPGVGGPSEGKVSVLSLIDSATGAVRSRVIPDVTGATLRKAIAEQVDMPNSVLYTDENRGYRQLGKEFAAHETVNHNEDEYVRYEGDRVITTNDAENFFSQLKRSIDGTHHSVSAEHLGRYLAEFDYRHSTRKMSDGERMNQLIEQVGGKRLTYKLVTR